MLPPAAAVPAPPPSPPLIFSSIFLPPPLSPPPRSRGDGRGFLAAEPAERRRVVIMGSGAADAEGVERLRDAEEAGGGGVLVGLLARGRKGTLRFGVALALGLGFALEADEGVERLFAGGAGGILEALAEPPRGMNLQGRYSISGGKVAYEVSCF